MIISPQRKVLVQLKKLLTIENLGKFYLRKLTIFFTVNSFFKIKNGLKESAHILFGKKKEYKFHA